MNINNVIKSAIENYQLGNLQQAEISFKKILKFNPYDFRILNYLGDVLRGQNKIDEAINCYQKALQIDPKYAGSYFNLGKVFDELVQTDRAIYYYQKAIEYDPSFCGSYNNLGNIYRRLGQEDKSIPYFEKAIEINTNNWGAYYNLGEVLQNKGQIDEAISLFRKALQLNPQHIASLNNLGNCLKDKGKVDESIICYQKAIKINSNFAEPFHGLGNAFITQGKLSEGICCFKKALKLKPKSPQVLFNLALKQRLSYNDSKELLELAENMINQDTSENDSIAVYFTMGKLCENLKMFEKSFEYYHTGNMLKRAQIEFNIDSEVDYLSRIKKTFSASFIEHRKSWGSDSEMPIFIFGMPRSGTTLVEQILASHRNIYGGGELQFFNQLDQKIASIFKVDERYPECLNLIDDKMAYDIAELYMKEIRMLTGASKNYIHITDKNLFNYYHLGLLSLLFPKASFIHCQRHPLDTCISIYSHIFAYGNYFAYDLSELGQYYLVYLKLMSHWRKVLPINIFELKYEYIVQQQEEVSRKLVEFCGLEWDPACLDFYKNDRPVFTASDWQVRQPIYTTSCGRWQNYDQFIAPLKELLADFI